MTELGIGLLGCGGQGRRLASRLNELPETRIVAVHSFMPEEAETLGSQLGVPAVPSYEALVQRPDVDAVIIASSHDSHMPQAVAAAAAGKHIFCEKPMALTLSECQAMMSAANHCGVKLMVGHVVRVLPMFARIKQIVDTGQLGTLVSATVAHYLPMLRLGWWARRSQQGGMLHSPACHDIDYLRYLFGEVESVYAVAGPQVQAQLDYADTMLVTMRYASGAVSTLSASLSSTLTVREGWILGDCGGLHYDAYASSRGGCIEYQTSDGQLLSEQTGDLGLDTGFRHELSTFVDWIVRDTPPPMTASDGACTVAIMEAAYRSAEENQPIPVEWRMTTPADGI